MKIFLNPGHCIGEDPGACGYGLTEADVAMNITRKVKDYLKVLDCEVKIFQFDGLAEIVDVANYWNADIFVSIHCNAANGYARGTESFFFSDEGEKLAQAIHNQILAKIPTVDRGVKEGDFYVIKYTNCPAVLIETAFIDNATDNVLLADNQDDFARAIACGISDYVADFYLPDI